jgi:hypothetical protein
MATLPALAQRPAPVSPTPLSEIAAVTATLARHPRLATFAATAAVLLMLNASSADRMFYADAANYWSLARSFDSGDGFSLDSYTDRLRGYSIPLLWKVVQQLSHAAGVDEIVGFRIFSALLGSALLAVVLPTLWAFLLGCRIALVPTLLFSTLGLLYWRGHLLYPLSDIPALLLLATGVLCLPREDRAWGYTTAAAAGACLALAANARPIHAAALPLSGLLVCWYCARAERRRLVTGCAFLLSASLALVPQARINLSVKGSLNPFAAADSDPNQPSLYAQQLAWGIAIQRYETNVGGRFPDAVIFTDGRGQDLLPVPRNQDPRVALAGRPFDFGAYLNLLTSNPWFFASAYARHLFNGLDVAYSTPYVQRVAPRQVAMAALNYAVLTVALVQLMSGLVRLKFRHRLSGRRLMAGLTFVAPAVLAVPTAVEPRFLLPIWMLAYGSVVFRLPDAGLRRPSFALATAVAGVAFGFALESVTYSNILDAPQTFDLWCLWCWDVP